jgi:vancomycin resistance protein VanW
MMPGAGALDIKNSSEILSFTRMQTREQLAPDRSKERALRHLVPFRARVEARVLLRRLEDAVSPERFADARSSESASFPHHIFSHKARLVRNYPEPWYSLQQNKIANLLIAVETIDGVTIGPEESFSFWRLVGRTSRRKGYLPGMTIIDGRLAVATGGGLCQLSNALYWVALHLGCSISERHRHSFDCFPDSYRSVPFGAGATVNYNYVDLRFRNVSEETYQLRVSLDDKHLCIDAFADRMPRYRYRVIEENHRMDARLRENDLVRLRLDGDSVIAREKVVHNEGRLLYEVSDG